MINHERITQALYDAIEEVNQLLPENQQLKKASETVILDNTSGTLDSQGLLNFTVAAEEKIEEALGVEISLTDENIFMQETSPLQTVGTLTDYILSIVEEKKIG